MSANKTIITAIQGAIASKGKNKGMLKTQCPPVNTPEAAAWQALMMFANPYKVGICHLMFMSEENKVIYNTIKTIIKEKNIDVRALDKDRKALELLGVW